MIRTIILFAAGISMTIARIPCTPGTPVKLGRALPCIKQGGFCYTVGCETCPPDRVNQFLCGPGLNRRCCLPKKQDFGCCEIYGDPHFKSFDGQYFSIQKAGTFMLATPCKDPTFQVYSVFYFPPGVTHYTLVDSATVRLLDANGNVISSATISRGPPLQVSIDGVRIQENQLPYSDGNFEVKRTGSNLYIYVPSLGITVCFNGNLLKLYVDKRHFNKLCGACGQYNDDIRDDTVDIINDITEDENCPLAGTEETRQKCRELLAPIIKDCETEVKLSKFLDECALDECVEEGASKFTIDALTESCNGTINAELEDLMKEQQSLEGGF